MKIQHFSISLRAYNLNRFSPDHNRREKPTKKRTRRVRIVNLHQDIMVCDGPGPSYNYTDI